jgi:dihydroxyacid dehydratase/phosphogluconate dehydratase
MAAARLDVPSVFLYGGSILPGYHGGEALDIVSVFEAVGANAVGNLSDEELSMIELKACPGEGSCAGMFTANTMASVGEALGMSILGSASAPSIDSRRDDYAYASGVAVLNPMRVDKGNAEAYGVAKLADGKAIRFLDINASFLAAGGVLPKEIMPDFLHPAEKGYELWAAAIKEPLAALLK